MVEAWKARILKETKTAEDRQVDEVSEGNTTSIKNWAYTMVKNPVIFCLCLKTSSEVELCTIYVMY